MAKEKKARSEREGRVLGDKKRLGYLKIRYNEVRAEMEAIKAETAALRKKLGATAKGEKAGDDED